MALAFGKRRYYLENLKKVADSKDQVYNTIIFVTFHSKSGYLLMILYACQRLVFKTVYNNLKSRSFLSSENLKARIFGYKL